MYDIEEQLYAKIVVQQEVFDLHSEHVVGAIYDVVPSHQIIQHDARTFFVPEEYTVDIQTRGTNRVQTYLKSEYGIQGNNVA